MGTETQKYLNEKQVAELTGLSVSTLQAHRHYIKGLPYVKISRAVRYPLEEVQKYMEQHTIYPDQRNDIESNPGRSI